MTAQRKAIGGPRGRPRADPRRTRVFYDRDAVLHLLWQFYPELLHYFPPIDSFVTLQGEDRSVDVSSNPSPIALLEVGRMWQADPSSEPHQGERAILCVWDRGGYNSDEPELIPYGYRGTGIYKSRSDRAIVSANGFDATGVFSELRENRTPRQNPALDDLHVIALFQFIMMLRGNRRYYWYGERHWESHEHHLAPLIQALGIVTRKSRQAYPGGPQGALAGAAIPPEQPLPPRSPASPHQLPYQRPPSPPRGRVQPQQLLPALASRPHSQNTLTTSERYRPVSPFPFMPSGSSVPSPTNPRLGANAKHTKNHIRYTASRLADPPSPQDSVINGDASNRPISLVLVATEAADGVVDNRTTTEESTQLEEELLAKTQSSSSDGQRQHPIYKVRSESRRRSRRGK
ncbi:uncharacterized protein M421DRAFT_7151 [Didymella exigua CBS 183.55]|uniref:Uncharacterized protein n=1 Tax=Didymella exigua CBS 183.55 TaxID=1150837 RepID=A0A6A5RD79_9PLEO|nr:uncharacterized protein M421DRAFT_7151 [Didymella exigua CBS 183.55]KAF1926215.1 hypothetical protein M421DRAFT_7151 [Didymella exigua CBS 183.55]